MTEEKKLTKEEEERLVADLNEILWTHYTQPVLGNGMALKERLKKLKEKLAVMLGYA